MGDARMRFEYLATFVPVAYEKEERGAWLFKEVRPLRMPIIESLNDNPEYARHLNRLGDKGWELVNAQPLLKGVWRQDGYAGIGYSLTAGYYLFWKRAVE
jgi:hypothetical protein